MIKNKNNQIKINLGCGKDKREGWINVDVFTQFKPDILHDLHKPLPFKNNYADYILAQDILEHFTREELDRVVSSISSVLKIGGILEIRVPNLDDIFERFNNDSETRNEFIYGTTLETGIFGAHKVGFTKHMLIALMLSHDLVIKSFNRVQTNFVVIFQKENKSFKKKKLVYINQTLGMGGAEVFMRDLLENLSSMGWKIIVYTNNNRFRQMLFESKIQVKKINTVVDVIGDWKGLIKGLILWPILLFEYWQIIIKENNADLFLLSGFIEKIIFTPLAKIIRKPSVWIEFGPMSTIFTKFLKLPKVLYFLVKSMPERVITSSYNSKNNLTSEARISLAKLRVVACGRNLKIAKFESDSINAIQNQSIKNLIVCVSRMEPGKGQDLLVKAFSKVVKAIPKAKLRIVGEGGFQDKIAAEVKSYELEKSVELVGYVKDSMAELKKAQVVVFPSVWSLEGFGLVLVEALSLGKPLVAFNNGPIPEIINDGENGLLAKNYDVDDLANKIIELLSSKKMRNKFSKQAKLDFKEKYVINIIGKIYSSILKDSIYYSHANLLCKKFH